MMRQFQDVTEDNESEDVSEQINKPPHSLYKNIHTDVPEPHLNSSSSLVLRLTENMDSSNKHLNYTKQVKWSSFDAQYTNTK